MYGIAVNGLVRYVGKGCKKRAWVHVSIANGVLARRAAGEKVKTTYFYNKLCGALRRGEEISPFIWVDGLTSEEAYAEERNVVAATDGLWNQMSGGIGPSSEDMKKVWRRHREMIVSRMNDPENLRRASENSKRSWADKDRAERWVASLRASWDGNEERRALISRQMKIRMASDEAKKKTSQIAKALWLRKGDALRATMRAAANTDEARRIKSERMKEVSSRPEIKQAKREASAARWADPKKRAALIAAIKAGKAKRKACQTQ